MWWEWEKLKLNDQTTRAIRSWVRSQPIAESLCYLFPRHSSLRPEVFDNDTFRRCRWGPGRECRRESGIIVWGWHGSGTWSVGYHGYDLNNRLSLYTVCIVRQEGGDVRVVKTSKPEIFQFKSIRLPITYIPKTLLGGDNPRVLVTVQERSKIHLGLRPCRIKRLWNRKGKGSHTWGSGDRQYGSVF